MNVRLSSERCKRRLTGAIAVLHWRHSAAITFSWEPSSSSAAAAAASSSSSSKSRCVTTLVTVDSPCHWLIRTALVHCGVKGAPSFTCFAGSSPMSCWLKHSSNSAFKLNYCKMRDLRDLKTPPAVIWCPRSSICILDCLSCVLFIYVWEWTRASPCWHRYGLVRTNSVLAYGHRGWNTASAALMLAWDIHQDGQRDNGKDEMKT